MSGGGNERRLGLGGTQLMEQAPLGSPDPAPPRAPGTQLIAQTPQASQPPAPPQPQWGPPPNAPQPFDFANAVPAYGIPPDAFQQAPPQLQPPPQMPQAPPAQNPYRMPEAPPAPDYGAALPLYGMPPTAYPNQQQSHGAFEAPKTDHLGPRLKGGAALLLGLALLGFNGVMIFWQGYFYPKTLILAFPVCWVGFFMVLAGKPVQPNTQTQPGWWLAGAYGGALLAFIVGIVAAILITD